MSCIPDIRYLSFQAFLIGVRVKIRNGLGFSLSLWLSLRLRQNKGNSIAKGAVPGSALERMKLN